MFGQNPVRKQELGDGRQLWIKDIWHTIQGEGPLAGRPAVFIRFAGCNLRCWFCDTDFENGTLMDVAHILTEVDLIAEPGTSLVVLTGGEPFLQNFIPLIRELNNAYHVQVETAGTLWVPGCDRLFGYHVNADENTLVCSPKTPKLNPTIIPFIDAYKYIVSAGDEDEGDGLPIKSTQRQGFSGGQLYRPPKTFPRHMIYLQPCDEQDKAVNSHNLNTTVKNCLKHGYRLSLQQHKIVGLG